MDKPKLLMIGYRAYGDWCHTFPVLPYLFDTYDVYADVNLKGWQLLKGDPRFKHLSVFEMERYPQDQWGFLAAKRIEQLQKDIPHDKFISFNHSLETVTVLVHAQPLFHAPVAHRRATAGSVGYYEAVFERAGIPFPRERLITDTMYFSEEELEWGDRWRNKQHAGQFIVIVAIAGTGMQKVFRDSPQYVQWLLDTYPDAVVYATGDSECWKALTRTVKSDRLYNACDETAIKQTFLMTKLADYVVGGETGVIMAAGMFGTPKTGLLTSAGLAQVSNYQSNDFSMQAQLWCSPCIRAIYVAPDCENMLKDKEGVPIRPACTSAFSLDQIKARTNYVYGNLRKSIPRGIPAARAV